MSRPDPIMEATTMDCLSPLQKAEKAIYHILDRIHTDPVIGYYCGAGSGSFAQSYRSPRRDSRPPRP